MKHGVTLVVALTAINLTASVALAQRGGFGGGRGGAFLLGQKSVQEELKLSEEQTKKVSEFLEKQRGGFAELRDLEREERQAKMRERAAASDAALKEILQPEQLKRLKQITLQQRGAGALADPEVAEALQLTSEQKEKLRAIQGEMRGAFQGGGGGGDRAAARQKFEELRKSTNEKAQALLTPEQQTKWKELIGEPFKGQLQGPQQRGRNRSARLSVESEQLVDLRGGAVSSATPEDALWNQVALVLAGGNSRQARFSYATQRGAAPIVLVGEHRRHDGPATSVRDRVHRRYHRGGHWGARHHYATHHRHGHGDFQAYGGHRRPGQFAGRPGFPGGHDRHFAGRPGFHGGQRGSFAGRPGHFGPRHEFFAQRHHHPGGPRFAWHGRPGHRPPGAWGRDGRPGDREFAGRPHHHRPGHGYGWGGPDHGPRGGDVAHHHRGGDGHGPHAQFSHFRGDGHHFHLSGWKHHRGHQGERPDGEHRHHHREGHGDRKSDRDEKPREKHGD